MRAPFIILIAALFMLAACVPAPQTTDTNETNVTIGNYTPLPEEPVDTPEVEAPEVEYDAVVRGVEGELIVLNPRVSDPDGDPVRLTFQPPFDAQGEWQTEVGDAGEFLSVITASDGELSATATVRIVVDRLNLPPTIVGPDAFVLDEGDLLDLRVYEITDPEGDDIIVSYSGWATASTRQTTFGDAGTHRVIITAQDTQGNEERKEITVVVNPVNRPPVLIVESDMLSVVEGEIVRIMATANDPDGETVTIRFGQPFDSAGRWVTTRGDAGTYRVPVTATDGTDTVEEIVTVVVNPANRPPTIDVPSTITVQETQTVDFGTLATIRDPDGDDVEVTYSGWMTESRYTTDFGDAGEYRVTIAATDGELTSSRTVTVVVLRTNRPPVFTRPA